MFAAVAAKFPAEKIVSEKFGPVICVTVFSAGPA